MNPNNSTIILNKKLKICFNDDSKKNIAKIVLKTTQDA